LNRLITKLPVLHLLESRFFPVFRPTRGWTTLCKSRYKKTSSALLSRISPWSVKGCIWLQWWHGSSF